MTDLLTVHSEVLALLDDLNVHPGPADDLPLDAVGLVIPAAVVFPSPGALQDGRLSGGPSGRNESTRVTCVGPHSSGCLWMVDRVRDRLAGVRLPSGGLLRDTSLAALEPTIEPGTGPLRVSVPLQFATITKGR